MSDLLYLSKGKYSGRNARDNYPIGTGDYQMSLGNANGLQLSRTDETFVIDGNTYQSHLGWSTGDNIILSQDVDVTGLETINFVCRLKDAENWKLIVKIGSNTRFERRLKKQDTILDDIYIPVVDLTGTQVLEIILEFI